MKLPRRLKKDLTSWLRGARPHPRLRRWAARVSRHLTLDDIRRHARWLAQQK